MALAWPLVALTVGLAFAGVFAVHLLRRRDTDADTEADLRIIEGDLLEVRRILSGEIERTSKLEAQAPRLQKLEDDLLNLSQRVGPSR